MMRTEDILQDEGVDEGDQAQEGTRHLVGARGSAGTSRVEADVRGLSASAGVGVASGGKSSDTSHAAHGRGRNDSSGAGSTVHSDVERARLSQDAALSGSVSHGVDGPVVADRPATGGWGEGDAVRRGCNGRLQDRGLLLGRIDEDSLEAGGIARDGSPFQKDR